MKSITGRQKSTHDRRILLVVITVFLLINCENISSQADKSKYSVKYDGNNNTGGQVPTDNSRYKKGKKVTAADAADLSRTDHLFRCWNTSSDGSGNDVYPGATFTIGSRDTILYAKWVPESPIFDVGFDYSDGTVLTKESAAAIFGRNVSYFNSDNRLVIYNNSLRFEYPQGKLVHESGGEIRIDLTASDTYTLQYDVTFDPAFDFSKGGKLPGLAGGTGTSGGTKCTGDGWNGKLMWRENGALKLYLYHMDMPDNTGEYFDLYFTAPKGEKITIKENITMNTGSNNDGKIAVYINGDLKLNLTSVKFMLTTDTYKPNISMILFYSFFDGSTAEWAPSATVYSFFDNVKLWNY